MTIPNVTLSNGATMPQLGFGTFLVAPIDARQAVSAALEAGYRHIDTAQMYHNELPVGQALAESGIPREEIFLTTKLDNGNHRPDDARRSFEASLQALQTDYVDLFLIHWPMPGAYGGDFPATWEVLQEFQADGRARNVGVSNFQIHHLEKLAEVGLPTPAVNQIEAHPWFANNELREYNAAHGIITQAWSPLGRGQLLADPAIVAVADRLGRTPAQVVLRWAIERGDVVFPKTLSPQRMKENFAIFDFSLDAEATAAIDSLDRGEEGRRGSHPDRMNRM